MPWQTIEADARRESALWGDAIKSEPELESIFSTLADDRYALGLETIYEGYLVHYGTSRLFDEQDPDVALLLGDYLYAHGLVRLAELGDVEEGGAVAELFAGCEHLGAESAPGGGERRAEAADRLGGGPAAATPRTSGLAAHARRVG